MQKQHVPNKWLWLWVSDFFVYASPLVLQKKSRLFMQTIIEREWRNVEKHGTFQLTWIQGSYFAQT